MQMLQPTNALLADLTADHHQQPQISLYLPTHRHHPENQQDSIRFSNLIKELHLLLEGQPDKQVRSLLGPLETLGRDEAFWNHTLDGLAVFLSPGWMRVVGFPCTVPKLVVVADSFHTKPLRRLLQSADRYQILGLNQHGIQLYEGNRYSLAALEPGAGVPNTIEEALGEELTEPHSTVASYGGVGHSSSPMHHGHGAKNAEIDNDADRYFRAVDRSVLEAHSRPSGLPLVLAALPEHHHRFHQVSHNPFLVPEGIQAHPDSMSMDTLRERAWDIFEPVYHERLAAWADDFVEARSKGLGLSDLTEIGAAAAAGRVSTLFIEADRMVVGNIDKAGVLVQVKEEENPQGDDLLDDLGELVVKHGGQVLVVPAAQMPATTGATAICRF